MLGNDVLYWIWLAQACGVASKNFVRLIERFSDPFEIYSLDSEQIEHIEGIGESLKAKLSDKRLEESYSVIKFCKKKHVDVITYADARYPSRLRLLEDPPVVLFCKGEFPDFNSRVSVGIVGTRKMSEYGRDSAYKIAYELASANVLVVSGMALGIDGVAACGALAAGKDTVAVLGSGVDVVYPKQHTKLYEKISKHGAVISEFMPSAEPSKYSFPIRNRIISGLCNGLLVVEGDRKSGALITAKLAIKQGRDVFALPGKVGESNSEGPNELIHDGTYMALGSKDIIEKYEFLYSDVMNLSAYSKAKRESDYNDAFASKLGISAKPSFEKPGITPVTAAKETVSAADSVKEKVMEQKDEKNEEMLAGLDEVQRKVFNEMPIDTAVSADKLVGIGYDVGDVVTALTMLEICGLVTALPGGLYIRK